MVLNDIIRSLSVIGVRGSFDIWLLLKRIKTKSQMKLTFKFNSIYADFGMFVAAFVAIRVGRGGTFLVSIVQPRGNPSCVTTPWPRVLIRPLDDFTVIWENLFDKAAAIRLAVCLRSRRHTISVYFKQIKLSIIFFFL